MQTTAIRKTAPVLFLIVCILMVAPLRAQEDVSPLIRLLERIPDHSAIAESFSYVDYRALINARPGAPLVTTAEAWLELQEGDTPERALWFAAARGISAGSNELVMYAFGHPVESRASTGIDPFAVERSVVYGEPPGAVTLFEGDFDDAQIAAAHIARDYVQEEIDGLTVWCGDEDCAGERMDPASRDPANPFGGAVGRRQPVLIADNLIASSSSLERLQAQADAAAGTTAALAENTSYHDAAEAVTQDGSLVQAWFINPADIGTASESLMGRLAPSEITAQLEALEAEFTPLPQYTLIAIADTAAENEQIALVALVYNYSDEASTAGEILVQHIEDYVSVAVRQPMMELLEARGVTAIDTEIYETDEHAVLLVRLHAPIPTAEPITAGLGPVSSSMLFQLLLNMYFQRDLGWLATTF